MTCIVGLEHEGGVTIGGDSAAVGGGYSLTVRSDEKVFRRGPFLMGFTTSFRMGQLLRYSLDVEVPDGLEDPEDQIAFMSTAFIDAVRECLSDGGWKKVDDERESGGTFLVAFKKRLYRVDSDFQVGRPLEGYEAVGCGHNLAKGALCALAETHRHLGWTGKVRIALEAAERWSAAVRGPFTILTTLEDDDG